MSYATGQHSADPLVRELIAASVNSKHKIGEGSEGVVYRVDSTDSTFDDVLIKRYRWNQLYKRDFPWQSEAQFCRKLMKSTSALVPLPNRLEGRHFAQDLMIAPDHAFSLLLKQPGIAVKEKFNKNTAPRFAVRYYNYLRWLETDVPDEAMLDLSEKIEHLRARNFFPDANKANIFWDNESQRFNLIDIFDKTTSLRQTPTRAAQDLYRKLIDADRMTPREAVWESLVYFGMKKNHRFLDGHFRYKSMTLEEKTAVQVLEARLAARLDDLVPNQAPALVQLRPSSKVKVEGIKNMGAECATDLKYRLNALRTDYGLSSGNSR